jgi:hypothetical protein
MADMMIFPRLERIVVLLLSSTKLISLYSLLATFNTIFVHAYTPSIIGLSPVVRELEMDLKGI